MRKFKIIVDSKECGTCSGPTPSAVAKKVVKKLCGKSNKLVKFSLKECKRGCERVCGPYQGRMEKLDKPCKRDGKTITHRVVCGKVKKMRGGRDLRVKDFEKREGDSEFRIDTKIGIEPYIFFGSINYLGYNSYNYVIFCEKSFGGQVVIRENSLPLNKLKLKDKYFIALLTELRDYLNRFNGFRRIKSYLNQKIDNHKYIILDKTPVFNLTRTNNITPTRENHQTILQNSCKKYPNNYQFSGKINDNYFNTNKNFRGIGNNRINRTLYEYRPNINKYILLLTKLDYLVNIYDKNDNPAAITYSGVLDNKLINAGNIKIQIKDIDYYLYCNKVCSELNLMFPCWIIFRHGRAHVSEGNEGNESELGHGRGNGPAQESGNGSEAFDMERISKFTNSRIINDLIFIYDIRLKKKLEKKLAMWERWKHPNENYNTAYKPAYNNILMKIIRKIDDNYISLRFHLDQSKVEKGSLFNNPDELDYLSKYLSQFGNTRGVTITPTNSMFSNEITIKGKTLIEFCKSAIYEYYKKL